MRVEHVNCTADTFFSVRFKEVTTDDDTVSISEFPLHYYGA